MKRLATLMLIIWFTFSMVSTFYAKESVAFSYLSPRPDAQWVSAATTIVVRTKEPIDEKSLTLSQFQVNGSDSGQHSGRLILAKDERTIIFEPDSVFMPSESVTVTVRDGIKTKSGHLLNGVTFRFSISSGLAATVKTSIDDEWIVADGHLLSDVGQTAVSGPLPSQPYMTVPGDFPTISTTVTMTETGEGHLFLASFTFWPDITKSKAYLMIVEESGDLIYYKKIVPGVLVFDFKKQPNGLLTYGNAADRTFHLLDSSYEVIDSYKAGNGYDIDFHDFQILPNGHALFMIYDPQVIDMSQFVPGGNPEAVVVGLVIQELDNDHNVVFEWRSWDHMAFTDSRVDLTSENVDYVHGNAVELDADGNILVSSRSLDEITKINRDSGEIMWRLGGLRNEFTLIGDEEFFAAQHDIRRLPNGNITLFDNRLGGYSRAVAYELDEENKTATLVWEYRHDPDIFSQAMGNAQRLPNGNTLINWGGVEPNITEVKADGTKVFELDFGPALDSNAPLVTYRGSRDLWQGFPTTAPKLISHSDEMTTTLFYSWNGATEISTYQIYGGQTPETMTLLDTQVKTGFETVSTITPHDDYCFFQVMPLNHQAQPTTWSNITLADHCVQSQAFIPWIMR